MLFDGDLPGEDEYKNILQLLLNAGYFRVQITTLSPFDKVVGGLTWCITWMGLQMVDIGKEVLKFKENANIGYKIALSEKLTSAIVSMGYSLEPHQIQGLDYAHLLPIFAALTRRVKEIRSKYGNLHKHYVGYLYGKMFGVEGVDRVDQEEEQLVKEMMKLNSPVEKDDTRHVNELKELAESLLEIKNILETRRNTRKELTEKLSQVEQKRKEFENDNIEVYQQITNLLQQKARIEDETLEFKLECKKKLRELKRQIADYESETEKPDYSDIKNALLELEVLDVHIRDLQYKLDEFPDSLELQQCQQRFIELYHQMSGKLVELRQKYTTYNTFESIRMQISRETSLLKSVYENIMKANSKQNQDKLMESLNEWQSTANDNLIRTESKVQQAKDVLAKSVERYSTLQDYERQYTKLLLELNKLVAR